MDDFKTLPELLQYVLNTYRNSSALNYRHLGQWEHVSTERFVEKVRRLALGLRALGLQPGQGFGIIASSSPYWLMMDLAIMVNRGISVPMFPNISSENFDFQVRDSGIHFLFIESEDLLEKPIRERLKNFSKIVSNSLENESGNAIHIHEVQKLGDALSETHPEIYADMRRKVTESDLATIIYTSGSTGSPKGAELTHRNLVSQIKATRVRFPIDASQDRMLSCLPLAHVFERMVMYYYVSTGSSIYFADDIKKVGDLAREIHPTVMTVVPRLLEKVFTKMNAGANELTGIKKVLVQSAMQNACTQNPENWSGLRKSIFQKVVFGKLCDGLGGKIRMLISGGSKLNPDIGRFFLNIGIPLYEGYGLTETSPVLAANFPGHNRLGSVGPIFPGVKVRVDQSGEILAMGPNIMRGYHNDPDATKKLIDEDGWLHTGDLGSLDDDGYLTITGRLKELFKTSNGKYVSPLPIEQALTAKDFIDLAIVIAENRHFPTALIFPDFENLETLQTARGMQGMDAEKFFNSKQIQSELKEAVDEINKGLSHWERLGKYQIILQQVSTESGEITPTMKVRRHIVEERFAEVIDEMYREDS